MLFDFVILNFKTHKLRRCFYFSAMILVTRIDQDDVLKRSGKVFLKWEIQPFCNRIVITNLGTYSQQPSLVETVPLFPLLNECYSLNVTPNTRLVSSNHIV